MNGFKGKQAECYNTLLGIFKKAILIILTQER